MRKLLAYAFLAASILSSAPVLAQERASASTLTGVSFSELAWAWDPDENGTKKATVEAAASAFGRSCGDTEFFAFRTPSPDAVAEATMDNFRDAGWKIDDFSGTEGPLYYRASLEGAEIAVAWTGVDSGAGLFLCNAIPVSAVAEDASGAMAQDAAPQPVADNEDDLDFSDSPYLFAAAFGLIGTGVLGMGVYNRRRASVSASWPQSTGTVTASGLGHEAGKDAEGDDYENWWPEVRYSYSVAGRNYEAGRVRFGDVKVSEESRAQAMIAPYPQGASVMVRYNPDKPEDATLETTRPGLGTPIFMGGIFLVLAVAALAAAKA